MQRKLKETSFMCDFSGHLSMCGEMTLDLKVQGSRSLCVCVFVCVCFPCLLACLLAWLFVCLFVCLRKYVNETFKVTTCLTRHESCFDAEAEHFVSIYRHSAHLSLA